MSADARELDRRLRAAGDLKGVVRTLKSLAAADLRPLQDSVQALEEYTRVLRLGAAVCLRSDSLAGAGGDSRISKPASIPALASPPPPACHSPTG